MFDYTYDFKLSKENISSIEIATNPNNYHSPLLKENVNKISTMISKDVNFRNKFYSLCFCSIVSQMWSEKATKFAGKSNVIYNPNLNCYEFAVAQKLTGESISVAKTYMFGMLNKRIKCTAFLYVKISVIINGENVTIKTKHYKTIAQQHDVTFQVSSDAEYSSVPFVVKDRKMFMHEYYEKKLSNAFKKLISYVIDSFESIEIFNGDFLNILNYLDPHSYYTSKDCQVIEAVSYMACKVFPLFGSLNTNEQIAILSSASAATQFEVTIARKYKANFQTSIFAKNLYFEIVKRHLDTIAVLSKFPQRLTMQKWNSSRSSLLYTAKDFEEFDYSNCNPNELVWVRYDSSNYHVNEIYSKLIPSSNIVNSLKISCYIDTSVESEDS